MKKSLLYIFAIVVSTGYAQCIDPLITDFECSSPSHPITGALVTVNNPASEGINTSINVGEYTDNGTDGFDALVVDYTTAIDLSVNNILKLKFYSPTSVQILAKLEGGIAQEIYSDFSDVNTWEEFTFDFSSSEGNGNTKIVLFFNPGTTDSSPMDVYYIDDLLFDTATTPPCNEPIITDFECSMASQQITGALVTVPNQVSGAINMSANIGQYTDDGTQGFDALIIDYNEPIELSSSNIFRLKLYSSSSVQVLAKLEGGIEQEIYSDFSAVNTWEEFTFDFSSSVGNGNTKIVLFFNPGVTSGTSTDIYYIDDLLFDSTLSLNNVNIDKSIKLFPNPVKDVINISSSQNIESYQIYDIQGKKVGSNNSEYISNKLSVNQLLSGIYFIRLNTANSNSVVRFAKQ